MLSNRHIWRPYLNTHFKYSPAILTLTTPSAHKNHTFTCSSNTESANLPLAAVTNSCTNVLYPAKSDGEHTKKKMRWQSGKKRQIRKQTLWQQQCGAWQAIGPQAVGAEEVARPGMGVGDGVSGYLLVGGWVKRQLNEMYSLLTFDSQQKKKKGNPAREKKLDKKSRETSCSPSRSPCSTAGGLP